MAKYLILAGMPCSGKSTLLRNSLRTRTSIFGRIHDDVFEKILAPPLEHENSLTLQDRLDGGYWLHELDIIHAKTQGLILSSNVIHFDIYWFYINLLILNIKLPDGDPRLMDKIDEFTSDLETARKVFGLIGVALPAESDIVSNLINPGYGEVCRRWTSRLESRHGKVGRRMKFLNEKIYNNTERGEAIYFRLMDAFKYAFGQCNDARKNISVKNNRE